MWAGANSDALAIALRKNSTERRLGLPASRRQLGQLLGPFVEGDAVGRVDLGHPPLVVAGENDVDVRLQLAQRPRRGPDRHVGELRLAVGADLALHADDRVPQGHAQPSSRVVHVRVGIDVQLQLPVVAELKEHLVDVRAGPVAIFKHGTTNFIS